MSMPNLEIYKFSKWWEMAVESWLRQNGINDVKKQRGIELNGDGTVKTLGTPRVEAKWLGGGFTREHYYVEPLTRLRWLDIYSGTGYLKIVTRRDDTESSHETLEALCRYLMQSIAAISSKMTFHVIEKMIEGASTITFETEKLHDVSALSFQTDIRINKEAFPTS